ncbi:ATP-dependent RNA helicase DDX41 [Fistulifera solaris]|uniref:RNA helicase n=1 Tax=Fistulifera solaris TaxID=1519565 RepID=A0A1Z5KGA2_FISSO|nr:ATP-dependent RNA helicase DDX41 [Fistulifera solaris]|eukprot:GAX24998.1 ATP-dependent RNA helicase DDX41 [Fistulifera solaris]
MGTEELDDERQKQLEQWKKKREARRRQTEETHASSNDLLATTADAGDVTTAAKRRRIEQERILLQDIVDDGLDEEDKTQRRKILAQRRKQALEAMNLGGSVLRLTDTSNGHGEDEITSNRDKHDDDRKNELQSDENEADDGPDAANVESLLDKAAALHQSMTASERAELARDEEEARILREASQVQTNALQAARDVAHGVVYKDPMPTSWRPPRYIMEQGEESWDKIRKEWHMQIQGSDIPPPLKRFVDMKFPKPVMDCLHEKGIMRPTPIQIQGLPVALAGRDMIGIAFTGSGKTLAFSLPLVMASLEEELRMPLIAGEGPVGIILAPSRELARQTFDLVSDFCQKISSTAGYPELRTQLLIGGESVRDQVKIVQQQGVHGIVATPGRLRDILKRRAMHLTICRYICLDEADRMLDMGFDEEVGEIMNFFPNQKQTLLFSATFPKKFQDFARQTLVKPIVVNVGRAGAANLDVIQEVEYVKDEAKIVYLLHCLQKTAPPVIIFCERKGAADDIHEYLLLKGVEAVSIHGGKDQEERNEAIKLFKEGKKDVLIATDVAAKGLDFPAIQHVINFDMPAEIENYVHRIGRTGRAGKTGVATTFINKTCEETTLLDLKALLREAKQRIPPVLEILEDPRDKNGGAGCSFCGGLGHTIVDCPKIDKDARRVAGSHKDVLAGGGDW